MDADAWDAAAAWNEPPPHGAPRRHVPIGGGRRLAEVLCCPRCDSTAIAREHDRAGDVLATWRCRGCAQGWRELANLGVVDRRAFLTGPRGAQRGPSDVASAQRP